VHWCQYSAKAPAAEGTEESSLRVRKNPLSLDWTTCALVYSPPCSAAGSLALALALS